MATGSKPSRARQSPDRYTSPGRKQRPSACENHHVHDAEYGRTLTIAVLEQEFGAAHVNEVQEEFWSLATKSADGCWIWNGLKNDRGYGRFSAFGLSWKAHRLAFLFAAGRLPYEALVLHGCDTPLCLNPAHLRLGNAADNVNDMIARGRQNFRGGIRLRGSRAASAKLTEDLVRDIRARYASGDSQAALAAAYGVKQPTISQIVRRTSWTHVSTEP